MPSHLTAADLMFMCDDPVPHEIRVNGHLGPMAFLAEIEALGLGLGEAHKVRRRQHSDPGLA
jgi:hypothetical protein